MFLGRRRVRRSLGGGRSLGEGGYTAKLLARLVHVLVVEFTTIIPNES
jgi:hypothetical protein